MNAGIRALPGRMGHHKPGGSEYFAKTGRARRPSPRSYLSVCKTPARYLPKTPKAPRT